MFLIDLLQINLLVQVITTVKKKQKTENHRQHVFQSSSLPLLKNMKSRKKEHMNYEIKKANRIILQSFMISNQLFCC